MATFVLGSASIAMDVQLPVPTSTCAMREHHRVQQAHSGRATPARADGCGCPRDPAIARAAAVTACRTHVHVSARALPRARQEQTHTHIRPRTCAQVQRTRTHLCARARRCASSTDPASGKRDGLPHARKDARCTGGGRTRAHLCTLALCWATERDCASDDLRTPSRSALIQSARQSESRAHGRAPLRPRSLLRACVGVRERRSLHTMHTQHWPKRAQGPRSRDCERLRERRPAGTQCNTRFV